MTTVAQSALGYGLWLSPGAVILSAVVGSTTGAIIALKSISAQRQIAKRRAMLDMLSKKEWDRDYLRTRAEFVKLKLSPTPLEFWAARDYKSSPQDQTIRSILNDYELIAVGIQEDILDELLFKRWYRGTFMEDYAATRKFIEDYRVNNDMKKAFIEFQALHEKWSREKSGP